MEIRSGARAAPGWGWRYFFRGYVVFYANATGIQEENQIGRGAAEKCSRRFGTFWSAAIGVVLVYLTYILAFLKCRTQAPAD